MFSLPNIVQHALANSSAVSRAQTLRLLSSIPFAVANFASARKYLVVKIVLCLTLCSSLVI